MERKPTSSTEAVARGSGSSMEGVRLTGKVMELQIGMAAATMMQVQVVLKALGKELKIITYMILGTIHGRIMGVFIVCTVA
ncbi:hypothetical protein VPH35_125490 [Triticum aestivum]